MTDGRPLRVRRIIDPGGSSWPVFAGSASLIVVGGLGVASGRLSAGLGLLLVAMGTAGVVVGAGTVLIDRASPFDDREHRETRAERIWGWVKVVVLSVAIITAISLQAPLEYLAALLGLLAVAATAGDLVIGWRAASIDSQRGGDGGDGDRSSTSE